LPSQASELQAGEEEGSYVYPKCDISSSHFDLSILADSCHSILPISALEILNSVLYTLHKLSFFLSQAFFLQTEYTQVRHEPNWSWQLANQLHGVLVMKRKSNN
jgi:hypothetical protein